jgi:gliding motility-associated-like protein
MLRILLSIFILYSLHFSCFSQLIGIINTDGSIDTLWIDIHKHYPICKGQCYQFVRLKIKASVDTFYPVYRWKFAGGNPTSSTERDPYVCFTSDGITPDSMYLLQLVQTNEGTIGYIGVVNPHFAPEDCRPTTTFDTQDTVLCQGRSVVYRSDETQLAERWHWRFEGGEPYEWFDSLPPPIFYPQPGYFSTTLMTENKTGSDTLSRDQYIHVLPGNQANADFKGVCSGIAGDQATISSCAIGDTYHWMPAEGLSCTDCSDPVLTYGFGTDYYCIVSNADRYCIDTCHIIVHSKSREERLFFPNVFTPNRDGINDVFQGSTWYATLKSIHIYNRWGACVYSSQSDFSWDGTFDGRPMDPDVYVYMVTYRSEFTGQIKVKSGSVTLLR